MAYVAAKGAVWGMTRVLAKELGDEGITVNGKPEHLANLIAFLASDEAEMITGQFMLADGGGYLHREFGL
jgi:3-oxoacyl-[acyl-carrier protein] reductase